MKFKIYIENTFWQNLCNATKAVLRGKFIVLSVCIRRDLKLKINNLSFHLRKLEFLKRKINLKQVEESNEN